MTACLRVSAHPAAARPAHRVILISAGNSEAIRSIVGLITPEMGSVVEEQRLGFAATICEDETANLSPKETVTVLDDDHLMLADLASPQT